LLQVHRNRIQNKAEFVLEQCEYKYSLTIELDVQAERFYIPREENEVADTTNFYLVQTHQCLKIANARILIEKKPLAKKHAYHLLVEFDVTLNNVDAAITYDLYIF